MTDTHVRDAEVHYVDTETCVHRLAARETGDWARALTERLDHVPITVHPAAQCPRPPAFLVAGLPSCDGHVVAVVVWEHQRGNPDVVVRRIV